MSEDYESWQVQTFTGVGTKVVRIEPIDRAVLVHFQTGEGDGHNSLEGICANGETEWFGVNTLGQYTGINLFPGSDEALVAFAVKCDVGWSLAVRPLDTARVWDTPQITGYGDDVLTLPDRNRGFSTIAINASSEDNTALWAYGDESADLLFNFIGPRQEEAVLPSAAWLISVNSNAPWGMSRG